MKSKLDKQFARFGLLVSLLCVLCASVVNSAAQDFKTIHDGVEYAQVDHKIGSDPVKINLLRLNLDKARLDVHHALDKAIGLETTSSIAKRKSAVAAINAGFFRLDNSIWAGDASGVLVVDGELYSDTSLRRTAIAIFNGKRVTDVLFEPISVFPRVYSKIEIPEINGINRERKKGEFILYSRVFGRTTLTNALGTEIIISKCRKSVCNEFQVMENVSDSLIPNDGYVLSMDFEVKNRKGFLEQFKTLSKGREGDRKLLIEHVMTPNNWLVGRYARGIFIVGGVPQLIKNGKIDITWEQEKASKSFVETRHPRTAVAKLKGGKFLMITVDGRQPGVSVGMNLNELAEYLLSLGAVDAMNLDGGGSTTMFLDGKVVNRPSDKDGERKVSDAILVTLRKKK